LYEARQKLSAMLTKVESKAKVEDLVRQLLSQPALLKQIADAAEKTTAEPAQQ
jgi:predicted component of type VI protein secretion system